MSQLSVITKIVRQKKRKDRYSIFLDETYAFSVAEEVLIHFQLTKGKQLSETEITNITKKDDYSKAYTAALRYLGYRMRTIQEMEAYLHKQDIPQTWIERIIVTLLDEGFLDDAVFANAFVRDRIHQTSKGPKVIEQELAKKGIKKEIIKQALEQYTFDKQYDRALKWLQKERRKKAKHAHKKQEEQLKIKLLQKGFQQDVIQEVFTENEPDFDEDREAVLFEKQAEKLYRKHSRKLAGFDLEMKLKTSLFQRGFQAEMIDNYIQKIRMNQEEEIDE